MGEDVILTPTDQHEITLRGLPPDTEHRVWVVTHAGDQSQHAEAPSPIRTLPAPADWTAPVRGVQNVRATATHNSITVWWDPPRADALPLYDVHLFRRLADGEGPEGDEEVKMRHVEVFDATGILLDGLALVNYLSDPDLSPGRGHPQSGDHRLHNGCLCHAALARNGPTL